MRLGYNTNGLSFHPLDQALDLIAEEGYTAVGLTLDHHCLNPFDPDLPRQIERTKKQLQKLGLAVVIETGARFLLNPRVKHNPTLLSPTPEERETRLDFLRRATDIAVALDSDVISFWSGALLGDLSTEVAMLRLADGCRAIADYAGERGIKLGFEPEPGMFIDTFDRFSVLHDLIRAPNFGLTVDLGHVHCIEPGPIPGYLREWRDLIWNVHIEDMNKGVHDHLMFGEGEMDFPPILRALTEIGYTGCVNVELSRHGHMAPQALRQSFQFLQPLIPQG